MSQVKRKTTEESGEVYETELAQLFAEEDEVQAFFAKLDGELNKVNQFYKKQESEFVERGEMLNKQLNILLELKQLLSNRCRKNPSNTGIFPHCHSQGSNYSGTHFFSFESEKSHLFNNNLLHSLTLKSHFLNMKL